MKKYILALDEGTTSARAVLVRRDGSVSAMAQREFPQLYPQPGWVEHDPEVLFKAQYDALSEVLTNAGAAPEDIAAIGITNQRETVIVWEKATGKPVYNAIVWQCRRTAEVCEELKQSGLEDYIKKTTGLKADAYFSATKIKWILDHVPGARQKAERHELLCGTVDTWLIWKLSGGRIHVTDRTNASRTMLYDIHRLCWDDTLLDALDIPKSMLPEVRVSSEIYGTVTLCGTEIPVAGIAGDQQAALFGQCCFEPGDVKNTYGTGCFLLMNTGRTAAVSRNGLLTTVCAGLKNEPVTYALEGSVFIGGAVVQWLRDELMLIHSAEETEALAEQAGDNGGVYIVPAFAGVGAPYWDMYARGTITGLTRGSGKNQIVRAALESIAYQTDDLIAAMKADSGLMIPCIRADGGAARNRFLMQFQADISDTVIAVSGQAESTAMGAAFLAGLAVGFWENRKQLNGLCGSPNLYSPAIENDRRQELTAGWRRAVHTTLHH